MKFLKYSIIVFLLFASAFSQSPELRGTWIAWAGADYPTKTEIADWMDQLAEHNINVVYVDVWRYGYPYWRSELFYNLTAKWTDPALEQGRDRPRWGGTAVSAHRRSPAAVGRVSRAGDAGFGDPAGAGKGPTPLGQGPLSLLAGGLRPPSGACTADSLPAMGGRRVRRPHWSREGTDRAGAVRRWPL